MQLYVWPDDVWKTRSSNANFTGEFAFYENEQQCVVSARNLPFVESRKTKVEREEETKWYSRDTKESGALFSLTILPLEYFSFSFFFFCSHVIEFCLLSFSFSHSVRPYGLGYNHYPQYIHCRTDRYYYYYQYYNYTLCTNRHHRYTAHYH